MSLLVYLQSILRVFFWKKFSFIIYLRNYGNLSQYQLWKKLRTFLCKLFFTWNHIGLKSSWHLLFIIQTVLKFWCETRNYSVLRQTEKKYQHVGCHYHKLYLGNNKICTLCSSTTVHLVLFSGVVHPGAIALHNCQVSKFCDV